MCKFIHDSLVCKLLGDLTVDDESTEMLHVKVINRKSKNNLVHNQYR